jgi:hypothetical protein
MKTNAHLSKEERIQLVLEGVLPSDYISHEELLEVLETLEELILNRHTTHNAPETLQ